jgi:hypothetical protein
MNIPTASEFIHICLSKDDDMTTSDIMIEFTKLHVQAALEAAGEKAIAKENPSDYGTGEIWVDEKSILKAYPLNNIK